MSLLEERKEDNIQAKYYALTEIKFQVGTATDLFLLVRN